jgi:hypothetical protein
VPIRWPRPSPLFEGPNQVRQEAPLAGAGQDPRPHARPAIRPVRRRGGPPGHSPCAPRDRRRGGGRFGPGSPPSRGWCRRPQGQSWRTFPLVFRWWIGPQERPPVRGIALPLVRRTDPRADDGIRTRDPHLGKVAGTGPLTCGDPTIWPASWAFSFACNGVVSRHSAVVYGTPTGPLLPGSN